MRDRWTPSAPSCATPAGARRSWLETARPEAAERRSRLHALQMEQEQLTSRRSAVELVRSRLQEQRAEVETLARDYEEGIAENLKPLPALESSLQENLREKVDVDARLADVRRRLDRAEGQIRAHEAKRQQSEAAVEQARSRIHDAEVEREGISARCADLSEQLQQTGLAEDEISAQLPEDADPEVWREQLERIERRIARLGAVNLAALEELETQAERKRYLDAQNDDLEQALDTLRSAINRIDRETKARFKATFDAVNEQFKSLFPKVFGGGPRLSRVDQRRSARRGSEPDGPSSRKAQSEHSGAVGGRRRR